MHLGGEKTEEIKRSRQSMHVIVWINWALSGGFGTSFQLKAIESSMCKFHSAYATVTEEG